jgi:hypothetical protein
MRGRRVVIPGLFNKLAAMIALRAPSGLVLAAAGRRNARRGR